VSYKRIIWKYPAPLELLRLRVRRGGESTIAYSAKKRGGEQVKEGEKRDGADLHRSKKKKKQVFRRQRSASSLRKDSDLRNAFLRKHETLEERGQVERKQTPSRS